MTISSVSPGSTTEVYVVKNPPSPAYALGEASTRTAERPSSHHGQTKMNMNVIFIVVRQSKARARRLRCSSKPRQMSVLATFCNRLDGMRGRKECGAACPLRRSCGPSSSDRRLIYERVEQYRSTRIVG